MSNTSNDNSTDKRELLLEYSWKLYYRSYFIEFLADKISTLWFRIDSITKLLVAFTASGSAIAGWVLWDKPGFKETWIFLAGFASIMSIAQSTLSVSERVKQWTQSGNKFCDLRNSIEGFREKMRLSPEKPIDEFITEYEALRAEYSGLDNNIPKDLLVTRKRSKRVQAELNQRLNIKS